MSAVLNCQNFYRTFFKSDLSSMCAIYGVRYILMILISELEDNKISNSQALGLVVLGLGLSLKTFRSLSLIPNINPHTTYYILYIAHLLTRPDSKKVLKKF
jgi:hypothetical protein